MLRKQFGEIRLFSPRHFLRALLGCGGDFDCAASLTLTRSGDYNRDLKVDDADYLIGQGQFGTTENFTADGNGDGVVDMADYVIWRDQYGFGLGISKIVVPEPSSLWMLGCAVPWLIASSLRR